MISAKAAAARCELARRLFDSTAPPQLRASCSLESARPSRLRPVVAVIFAGDFDVGLRLRYLVLLFFGGCVSVYVLAAFRVKPNVHGAVVDYFNFVN